MPFVEGFGRPLYQYMGQSTPNEIDFRWEREWRVGGHFKFEFSDVAFGLCKGADISNFEFEFSDVAFGLCKGADISNFEKVVGGAFPFVDPTQDMKIVKEKLNKWAKLKDLK